MRTKWQLVKECCAHHLQVRAGVKPGVVVAWSCSCNGWWLLGIAPEIAGLGSVFWKQAKKLAKKAKETYPPGGAAPSPSCGTPPASSAEPSLALALPSDISHLIFFPTKICLSSCPSLLNYETLWQTKPMPEDALGAGRRGKLPLQTEVSAPAARAQEPGSAAGSSATRTWICHVGVRRTKPCWGHALPRPPTAVWRTQPLQGFVLRKDHLFMNVHLLKS